MRVLRRPYRVTTHKAQFMPAHCDNCSPIVQPIWQNSTVQLFEGGNWDGTKDRMWTGPDGSVRYKPATMKFYEGYEVVEPDPWIATPKTTGEVVRFLWRSGRCEDCIINILSDTRYKAGAWYRFNPDWCHEHIINKVDSTDSDSYYSSQVGLEVVGSVSVPIDYGHQQSIGTETTPKPPVEIKPKTLRAVLRWLSDHPEAMQKDIHAARLITWKSERANKGLTDAYLKAAEEQGLIRKYKRHIPGKKGHPVAYEVVTPEQPQEEFLTTLTDEQIEDLLPAVEPHEPTLENLEELVALV